tara:strand:+ start:898 stop:1224 length:327 start_codon:yes stop_codon:yes gene_type:complete
MKTIETKIGDHRGGKRVWIEGNNLALNGWQTGEHYTREVCEGGFVLTKNAAAKLKVAKGKQGRPVLDLCGKYVEKALGDYQKAIVTITPETITIKGATVVVTLATLAA